MSILLSPDSQAVLLLTAPLMAGPMEPTADLLTSGEFRRLATLLQGWQRSFGDLLSGDADGLVHQCSEVLDADRLKRLLGRGFLLGQAVERWQARAIWVITSADAAYPKRLRERLQDKAPPVLYGCGDAVLLETGGLAVVGSRNATPVLLAYTERIGQLAAHAGKTIVSGGARGIDQASMQGALEAGGTAVGMLADSLERTALRREYRSPLMERRLALVSPYDPLAGFNIGNAMQRNKLIYALADAALVISSDYLKGGTWAGAVEQVTKLKLVPVYVRSRGELGKGLIELQRLGALPWPNPTNSAELVGILKSGWSANTVRQDEAAVATLVHEASSDQPIILATKPAPAKRRSRSKKHLVDSDGPTLFGADAEVAVSDKHTTGRSKKSNTRTSGEEGESS